MPSPHTTFESTEMTGRTLEHVEHRGSGLPSGPLGTSRGGSGSFAVSGTLAIEGRPLKARGSASSFFTFTSSFPAPFRLLTGVGTGVATSLPLPLSAFFLAERRREEVARVTRFAPAIDVSGGEMASKGGVTSCGLVSVLMVSIFLAFCRRVEIMDRYGDELLLFRFVGVGNESPVEDRELSEEEYDGNLMASGAGVMRGGEDCAAEGATDGVNDVSSEVLSISIVNSISPSPGMS